MVLSNKKLKQKLRAAKAEVIAKSEAANPLTDKNYENSLDLGSLRTTLNMEAKKPRLSKREKRRQNAPKENTLITGTGQTSGDADPNKEDMPKSDAVQVKKKKKRKRDESDASKNVKEKKQKKKKKMKKKPKEKVENGKLKEEVIDQRESGTTGEKLLAKTDESTKRINVETSLKVYVGGIPYYSTEDDIRSYFEGCGTITSVDCMTFPDTGKFRGIAIITFKTEAAAKRALALDGSDMGGLFLKIQPFKSAKVNKLPNFSPSVVNGYNRIYVGNLSWDITEDDLRKPFADCTITSIRFGEDKETGEFKGYAHVDFADSPSLNAALKLDQTVVCGRPIRISCAVPKKGTGTKSISIQKDGQEDHGKKGNATKLEEAAPEVNEADNDNVNVVVEDQIVACSGTNAVSSKIRRRTCYECGEKGHLSSSCPNRGTETKSTSVPKDGEEDCGKKGNTTKLEEAEPGGNKADNGNDNLVENQLVASSGTNAISSKIRRRTCYECGEKGHLSSSCPKKQAADSTNPATT